MLKWNNSQNFELKDCVFWAPGSQKLAILGEQICRNVHWTYFDPVSSGGEHIAGCVWCGTPRHHHDHRISRCWRHFHWGAVLAVLCWRPEHVPPSRALVVTSAHWCSEWCHALTTLQTPSVTNYVLSLSKNQIPPLSHQKKEANPSSLTFIQHPHLKACSS